MKKRKRKQQHSLVLEDRFQKPCRQESFDVYRLGSDSRGNVTTDSRLTGCNNNYLIVGGSGSGKTEGIAKPMIHSTVNSNLVVVCTKKEIIQYTVSDLKEKGYRTLLLNLVEPEKSLYGYDPLFYCQNSVDVHDLAHTFMRATNHRESDNDPFWSNSAENLMATIMDVVRSGNYEKGKSMDKALYLLDYLFYSDSEDWKLIEALDTEAEIAEKKKRQRGPLDILIEKEEKKKRQRYPLHILMEEKAKKKRQWNIVWETFINLPEQTGSCVAASVQEPLNKVFTEEIRTLLRNEKKFTFAELLQPKTAVIVYVSPVNRANHAFVSIFYQQLFKNLFELAEKKDSGKLPYPVQVICDDFATGCKVPEFQELISIFREKRIGVTLLIQSESQLAAMYGDRNATTIINNCDTYVYLGGMDLKTCESISKRLNIPSYEVLNMPIGMEYVFRRGQEPIKMKRYSVQDVNEKTTKRSKER